MKKNIGIGVIVLLLLVMALPSLASADTLIRQLQIGMSGSDVSTLQGFLAEDDTIYPQGLITGYFGFLTKAAVSNFQKANGIDPVGRVGPITLAAINRLLGTGVSSGDTGGSAPIISSVSISKNRNNATVNWNTNTLAQGKVFYSTSPLSTVEHLNSVDVSVSVAMANSNLLTNQSVLLPDLLSNTIYYYMIYSTDQQGDVSVSWPTTFRTAS